jgi:hypothetical protein
VVQVEIGEQLGKHPLAFALGVVAVPVRFAQYSANTSFTHSTPLSVSRLNNGNSSGWRSRSNVPTIKSRDRTTNVAQSVQPLTTSAKTRELT